VFFVLKLSGTVRLIIGRYIMDLQLFNEDCMEVMARYPDDYFDLAIVDPPYGHGDNLIRKGNTRSAIATGNNLKSFDNSKAPNSSYFKELKRASKNQIIWGANHFSNKFDSSGSAWIVWDKETTGDFSDCELAYSSFGTACRRFHYMWNGMHQGGFGGNTKKNVKRIHPTQKPVKLYEWLLTNYAKPEFKILDTHLGSGSSVIAAHYYGIKEFVGCDLDKDYFEAAKTRIDAETAQIDMF